MWLVVSGHQVNKVFARLTLHSYSPFYLVFMHILSSSLTIQFSDNGSYKGFGIIEHFLEMMEMRVIFIERNGSERDQRTGNT